MDIRVVSVPTPLMFMGPLSPSRKNHKFSLVLSPLKLYTNLRLCYCHVNPLEASGRLQTLQSHHHTAATRRRSASESIDSNSLQNTSVLASDIGNVLFNRIYFPVNATYYMVGYANYQLFCQRQLHCYEKTDRNNRIKFVQLLWSSKLGPTSNSVL